MKRDNARLVIMGPPGAGKGTQGKAIAACLGITHISTGDILRAEIASGSEIGIAAGALIDKGEFVPDAMITEIVFHAISIPPALNGFLLDGFPRTLRQAKDLADIEDTIDTVIQLSVPDEELIRRIVIRADEGRADDTLEILSSRLRIYRERTLPILEFFERLGMLEKIDGTGNPGDVTEAILQRVAPLHMSAPR